MGFRLPIRFFLNLYQQSLRKLKEPKASVPVKEYMSVKHQSYTIKTIKTNIDGWQAKAFILFHAKIQNNLDGKYMSRVRENNRGD